MATNVLITGGAGYLGSVLCEHLLDAGYRVTVLDRLYHGQAPLFHLCDNPALDFVPGDVRDEALVRRLVKDANVIIPLAAVVGAPACDRDPWLTRAVNLDAVKLLNQIRSPRQLVVYPNTNSGYGTQTGEAHCTEDTPLDPISLYGQTKCQAEIELFGEPQHDHAPPGHGVRDFAADASRSARESLRLRGGDRRIHHHLREGFQAELRSHPQRGRLLPALHCPRAGMIGRPYNVGLDAANVSKETLAKMVQTHVPRFVIHFSEIGVDPDKRDYIVSNQRLREAGFEARRSLDDGIQELIKGYRMMGRSPLENV